MNIVDSMDAARFNSENPGQGRDGKGVNKNKKEVPGMPLVVKDLNSK